MKDESGTKAIRGHPYEEIYQMMIKPPPEKRLDVIREYFRGEDPDFIIAVCKDMSDWVLREKTPIKGLA